MELLKSNNSLHIEVETKNLQVEDKIKDRILKYLDLLLKPLHFEEAIDVSNEKDLTDCQTLWIQKNVYKDNEKNNVFHITDYNNVVLHLFHPHNDDSSDFGNFECEVLEEPNGEANGGGATTQVSVKHYLLPAKSLVGLWQSLHMEADVKEKLLRFSLCSLMLKKYKLDANKISCNNLIVLYGPPGTGKTSLCKALGQKIAIRQSHRYKYTHLIEINSHNLLSKWFSESGKLIGRIFNHIRELASDSRNLVIVLIDEVESIAYERTSLNDQEPKDSMRVVNAFLTELDSMKKYTNILILATSNLEKTIDSAFLDRADIMIKINLPTKEAREAIFKTMFKELYDKNLLGYSENSETLLLKKSEEYAERTQGLTGRTLSKIPYYVFADINDDVEETNIQEENFFSTCHKVIQNYFEVTK